MTTTDIRLRRESVLMGLLDRMLGVSNRSKPKKVTTDPIALHRIEQTQEELAARLDVLDERVQRVEDALPKKGTDNDHP